MDKLLFEFSPGLFIWQTLIFTALILVLRKFAWKPILGAVNEREQKIEGALQAAEEAKQQMADLQTQNADLRKEALAERDTMMKEARETRDKVVAEAKGQAKEEADRIIASARESIKNEKLAAITDIKNQVATLSIEIAEKIVKTQLSSDDKQKALVDGLVEEVNLN